LATNYGITDAEGKQKDKYKQWLSTHQPFHWFAEFYQIVAGNGGFDCIIGNPPYVVYSKSKVKYNVQNINTISSNNLYAFIVEKAITLSKSTNIGFIIPSAAFGTKATKSFRKLLLEKNSTNFISYLSGDAHPSVLFEGVKLRLSIIISNKFRSELKFKLYSTKYLKWYSDERQTLFNSKVSFKDSTKYIESTFSKIYTDTDEKIINKMAMFKKLIPTKISNTQTKNIVYYHNAPVFFVRGMNFIPIYESESSKEPSSNHFKRICFQDSKDSIQTLSIINSSIFFYWFTIYSANRDLTSFDIYSFPIVENKKEMIEKLLFHNTKLMSDLNDKSVMREYNYKTGKVRYQEFYMRLSKPIIDQIDTILAQHYGFTEEELDFIINYDIKYRMGKELFGEEK